MKQPFDAAAKALIDAALTGVCDVTLQAPTTPDTMYIDALVEPIAPQDALRSRGLLGRLALTPCAIEAFSETPGRFDVDLCLARCLFVSARRRVAHRLWVISPGEPRAAIEAWGVRRRRGWPRGVLSGQTPSTPSVVVLSQLPTTRDTILLRLMSSGERLRDAITDARRLPRSSWERGIIDEVLLQMKRDLDTMLRNRVASSEELQMRYAELVKINEEERAQVRSQAIAEGRALGIAAGRKEGIAAGRKEGIAAGRNEGIAAGREEGLRLAVFDLCEVLAIDVQTKRRRAVEKMSSEQLEQLRESIKRHRRWPDE